MLGKQTLREAVELCGDGLHSYSGFVTRAIGSKCTRHQVMNDALATVALAGDRDYSITDLTNAVLTLDDRRGWVEGPGLRPAWPKQGTAGEEYENKKRALHVNWGLIDMSRPIGELSKETGRTNNQVRSQRSIHRGRSKIIEGTGYSAAYFGKLKIFVIHAGHRAAFEALIRYVGINDAVSSSASFFDITFPQERTARTKKQIIEDMQKVIEDQQKIIDSLTQGQTATSKDG